MRHDAVSVQPSRRVDLQQLVDEVFRQVRDIVPVGRREFKLAGLDHLEQRLIVLIVERWEPAKPSNRNSQVSNKVVEVESKLASYKCVCVSENLCVGGMVIRAIPGYHPGI